MAPAHAQPLVLRGATLVDATGREPVANSVVVIEGERIRCAGAPSLCPVPADARLVELAGRWITPGLIDTHVHLHLGPEASPLDEQAVRFAHGITSTREAGSLKVARALRERREAGAGRVPRPRLFVAARVAAENYEAFTPGRRDVDALVARFAELGVSFVKIKDQATIPEVEAAVRAALRHGLSAFGHCWGKASPTEFSREAFAAGLAGVTHLESFPMRALADPALLAGDPGHEDSEAYWKWRKGLWQHTDAALLDATIDDMVRQGVWLEPTLTTEYYYSRSILAPPALDFFNPILSPRAALRVHVKGLPRIPAQAPFPAAYAVATGFVRRFAQRGGLLVTGGDNKKRGWDVIEEIRLLRAAGLSPLSALQAATRNAAIALGGAEAFGTLEPGRLADLNVYGSDPLGPTDNMADLVWVVKGGSMHDAERLRAPFRVHRAAELRYLWTRRIGWLASLTALGGLLLFVAPRLRRRWRARRGA